MVSRRTKYGWMALGGALCLFSVVLACKVRDGNKLAAQTDPTKEPLLSLPSLPAVKEPGASIKVEKVAPPTSAASGLIPPPPGGPVSGLELTGGATPPAPADAAPPPPSAGGVSLPPTSGPGPLSSPPSAFPGAGAAVPLGSEPRPILIPGGNSARPMPAATPIAPPGAGPASPPPSAPSGPASDRTLSIPPPAPATPPGAVVPAVPPPPAIGAKTKAEVILAGEPPLAPAPGPVLQYRVRESGESFRTISRRTLGSSERWSDIHKLNPSHASDGTFPVGTVLRLPGDACVQEDGEVVKPLPSLRARPASRVKVVMPLTGTFPITLDEKKVMTLPRSIRDQLGNCEQLLISPGPDKCLWLTNQPHLDRLTNRLENSPAREADLRVFRRLYYAQTVKVPMKDGRVAIADRLAQFAGLDQELVLVGIDDHFEIWDAARWRRYTQTKKAAPADAE